MNALQTTILVHPELLPSHFLFIGVVEVKCVGNPVFYMINGSSVHNFHQLHGLETNNIAYESLHIVFDY